MVVSVYATAYAVTLILGGRLGDMFGRKRVYLGACSASVSPPRYAGSRQRQLC